MSYAEFWRNERLKRRLTQAEFGSLAKVHGQFVSNVERGLCRYPLGHVRMLILKLDLEVGAVVDIILKREEDRLYRALNKKVCGSGRSK